MSKAKSLTSRIGTRFREGAKSIASSIGFQHGESASKSHDLFYALDTDRDGFLTRADVSAWFLDELFINNPYFEPANNNVSSVDELVSKYWTRWDRLGHGRISYDEWSEYMRGKKDKEVEEMARSVLHVSKERKEKATRKIFDAIDVNGSGDLDFDSINAWLKYDAAYASQQGLPSAFHSEEHRQFTFDQLDRDQDGCVTFDDLNSYLQNWSVREMRVRTAAMRQDAETRKMKRMAELLAATMASRLGLGGEASHQTNDTLTVRGSSVSGGRPRSVSDMAAGPPSSLNGVSVSVAPAGTASAARGRGAGKAKPTKSNIQRQIDDLVLQSLALAAESSEINAKRRKLNIVNEKLDRELVRCERERLKLITQMTEMENELGQLQPAGAVHPAEVHSRLSAINTAMQEKRDSLSLVASQRSALETSSTQLAQKQAEIGDKLSTTTDSVPAADAFIQRTKETTAKIERALDTVQVPVNAAPDSTALAIDLDKSTVERKLAELKLQVAQVEAQRAGLLADQQSLKEDLQHTQEEVETRRKKAAELDTLIPQLQASLQQLERERAALEARQPPSSAMGSRYAELSSVYARQQEVLATLNNDREHMSQQLREMESQHNVLTRRHVEISTQLTNINQQISILFDGQLYERRNSFGETAHDGVHADALPVPCVASVECEMDGRKTTGLLNVSNYILMYESRIATYVGRGGLGGVSPEHQSPPSASSPVMSSRRSSVNANTTLFSDSTRFCVDISDVTSVKFIHTNDDDGHEEEGYEDEGLSELESSLKEPSIATIIIQLRPGYHNRFLSSETSDGDDASHVITPPNSGGGARPATASAGMGSASGSPRASTVVCFGDYDSLRRVDKSLRLFMTLIEEKISHQAFRRRAASVQVTSANNAAYMEEKIQEYRKGKKASPDSHKEQDITITGFSEITSIANLRRILASAPSADHQWRLAYSQSQHGSSFPYFFRVCSDSPHSIVLLKSEAGRIFGGYCGAEWEDRIHQLTSSYYGTKDCYVFRLTEDAVNGGRGGVGSTSPFTSSASTSSSIVIPGLSHANTEPLSPHDSSTSLLTPSTTASSIVMDTMLKATHAVEVASAAGLDVAPAVRRASIDTTAMSMASGHPHQVSASSASDAEVMDVPHVPSTLEVFPASGINAHYMYSSPDLIAMGGRSSTLTAAASAASSVAGGWAWSIDRDFREGSSNECDTYRSPVLAEAVEWQCAKLEVWVPVQGMGFRSSAAPGAGSGDDEADEGDGLRVQGSPMVVSVTPPTASSPQQVVSP